MPAGFTVVTGHRESGGADEVNWEALAQTGTTLIVLMGVAHRRTIAERLMRGGLAADTPVCAVRWGTRPEQETLRTRLDSLGDSALEAPCTMVIGPVAALDFSSPLFGLAASHS